mmetsp:Transcript_119140/g.332419  ORF Transcript_119140/g.332419 Transcript_119140/m.332419 type:complete len:319 (-) Transcript_119140:106-1062(-)
MVVHEEHGLARLPVHEARPERDALPEVHRALAIFGHEALTAPKQGPGTVLEANDAADRAAHFTPDEHIPVQQPAGVEARPTEAVPWVVEFLEADEIEGLPQRRLRDDLRYAVPVPTHLLDDVPPLWVVGEHLHCQRRTVGHVGPAAWRWRWWRQRRAACPDAQSATGRRGSAIGLEVRAAIALLEAPVAALASVVGPHVQTTILCASERLRNRHLALQGKPFRHDRGPLRLLALPHCRSGGGTTAQQQREYREHRQRQWHSSPGPASALQCQLLERLRLLLLAWQLAVAACSSSACRDRSPSRCCHRRHLHFLLGHRR